MLRQNRYATEDFMQPPKVVFYGDEIQISKKHNIDIILDTHQTVKYHQLIKYYKLKKFVNEITRNVPKFDNMTQDFYESRNEATDFPHFLYAIYIWDQCEVYPDYNSRHNLSGVRFEKTILILDYVSEKVNNTFNIFFQYDDPGFSLISWNGIEITGSWSIS